MMDERPYMGWGAAPDSNRGAVTGDVPYSPMKTHPELQQRLERVKALRDGYVQKLVNMRSPKSGNPLYTLEYAQGLADEQFMPQLEAVVRDIAAYRERVAGGSPDIRAAANPDYARGGEEEKAQIVHTTAQLLKQQALDGRARGEMPMTPDEAVRQATAMVQKRNDGKRQLSQAIAKNTQQQKMILDLDRQQAALESMGSPVRLGPNGDPTLLSPEQRKQWGLGSGYEGMSPEAALQEQLTPKDMRPKAVPVTPQQKLQAEYDNPLTGMYARRPGRMYSPREEIARQRAYWENINREKTTGVPQDYALPTGGQENLNTALTTLGNVADVASTIAGGVFGGPVGLAKAAVGNLANNAMQQEVVAPVMDRVAPAIEEKTGIHQFVPRLAAGLLGGAVAVGAGAKITGAALDNAAAPKYATTFVNNKPVDMKSPQLNVNRKAVDISPNANLPRDTGVDAPTDMPQAPKAPTVARAAEAGRVGVGELDMGAKMGAAQAADRAVADVGFSSAEADFARALGNAMSEDGMLYFHAGAAPPPRLLRMARKFWEKATKSDAEIFFGEQGRDAFRTFDDMKTAATRLMDKDAKWINEGITKKFGHRKSWRTDDMDYQAAHDLRWRTSDIGGGDIEGFPQPVLTPSPRQNADQALRLALKGMFDADDLKAVGFDDKTIKHIDSFKHRLKELSDMDIDYQAAVANTRKAVQELAGEGVDPRALQGAVDGHIYEVLMGAKKTTDIPEEAVRNVVAHVTDALEKRTEVARNLYIRSMLEPEKATAGNISLWAAQEDYLPTRYLALSKHIAPDDRFLEAATGELVTKKRFDNPVDAEMYLRETVGKSKPVMNDASQLATGRTLERRTDVGPMEARYFRKDLNPYSLMEKASSDVANRWAWRGQIEALQDVDVPGAPGRKIITKNPTQLDDGRPYMALSGDPYKPDGFEFKGDALNITGRTLYVHPDAAPLLVEMNASTRNALDGNMRAAQSFFRKNAVGRQLGSAIRDLLFGNPVVFWMGGGKVGRNQWRAAKMLRALHSGDWSILDPNEAKLFKEILNTNASGGSYTGVWQLNQTAGTGAFGGPRLADSVRNVTQIPAEVLDAFDGAKAAGLNTFQCVLKAFDKGLDLTPGIAQLPSIRQWSEELYRIAMTLQFYENGTPRGLWGDAGEALRVKGDMKQAGHLARTRMVDISASSIPSWARNVDRSLVPFTSYKAGAFRQATDSLGRLVQNGDLSVLKPIAAMMTLNYIVSGLTGNKDVKAEGVLPIGDTIDQIREVARGGDVRHAARQVGRNIASSMIGVPFISSVGEALLNSNMQTGTPLTDPSAPMSLPARAHHAISPILPGSVNRAVRLGLKAANGDNLTGLDALGMVITNPTRDISAERWAGKRRGLEKERADIKRRARKGIPKGYDRNDYISELESNRRELEYTGRRIREARQAETQSFPRRARVF